MAPTTFIRRPETAPRRKPEILHESEVEVSHAGERGKFVVFHKPLGPGMSPISVLKRLPSGEPLPTEIQGAHRFLAVAKAIEGLEEKHREFGLRDEFEKMDRTRRILNGLYLHLPEMKLEPKTHKTLEESLARNVRNELVRQRILTFWRERRRE